MNEVAGRTGGRLSDGSDGNAGRAAPDPPADLPFAHPGAGIVIVGPTGCGRSSLVQACLYDGAGAGLRGAYPGSE